MGAVRSGGRGGTAPRTPPYPHAHGFLPGVVIALLSQIGALCGAMVAFVVAESFPEESGTRGLPVVLVFTAVCAGTACLALALDRCRQNRLAYAIAKFSGFVLLICSLGLVLPLGGALSDSTLTFGLVVMACQWLPLVLLAVWVTGKKRKVTFVEPVSTTLDETPDLVRAATLMQAAFRRWQSRRKLERAYEHEAYEAFSRERALIHAMAYLVTCLYIMVNLYLVVSAALLAGESVATAATR